MPRVCASCQWLTRADSGQSERDVPQLAVITTLFGIRAIAALGEQTDEQDCSERPSTHDGTSDCPVRASGKSNESSILCCFLGRAGELEAERLMETL